MPKQDKLLVISHHYLRKTASKNLNLIIHWYLDGNGRVELSWGKVDGVRVVETEQPQACQAYHSHHTLRECDEKRSIQLWAQEGKILLDLTNRFLTFKSGLLSKYLLMKTMDMETTLTCNDTCT